jgi:SpoIID/LytB domain protein
VEYTQQELSQILKEKSGMDFGDIVDFVPVERGTSGRLVRLKIVGTKKTLTVGKELEIRRLLSTSHLYSSAFVVDKYDYDERMVPGRFVFVGAGWGHGVGLCQIGAAVMSTKGFTYKEILQHYFKGATIKKQY